MELPCNDEELDSENFNEQVDEEDDFDINEQRFEEREHIDEILNDDLEEEDEDSEFDVKLFDILTKAERDDFVPLVDYPPWKVEEIRAALYGLNLKYNYDFKAEGIDSNFASTILNHDIFDESFVGPNLRKNYQSYVPLCTKLNMQ